MYEFYKKALIALVILLAASLLAGYICVQRSYLELALFPAADSPMPWRSHGGSDHPQGGASTINIIDDKSRLRWDFTIVRAIEHPFTAAELNFVDRNGKPLLVNLSRFSSIAFNARCAPANTLTIGLSTFDPKISKPGDMLTYRSPIAYFSCSGQGDRHEIDLNHLETPQWWFDMFKLDISQQAYKLDMVARIWFGTTFQSPAQASSQADVSDMVLTGRDYRYLTGLGILLIAMWSGYAFWFFRQHTRALVEEVKAKMLRDLPLVAYQQLSLEPHKDKEKSTILQFIATNYAKPDLDLDGVVAQTGVNRNKINEILKSELGFTFSGYVNKLRLTEAARLLVEKDNASVAEIAYLVGYGNVSYFNKLFKEEYNCTPKAFRTLCKAD